MHETVNNVGTKKLCRLLDRAPYVQRDKIIQWEKKTNKSVCCVL